MEDSRKSCEEPCLFLKLGATIIYSVSDVGSWRDGGGRAASLSEDTDAGPGTTSTASTGSDPQGSHPSGSPESAPSGAGGPAAMHAGMRPGMPGMSPHMGGMMPPHLRAMMPPYVSTCMGVRLREMNRSVSFNWKTMTVVIIYYH